MSPVQHRTHSHIIQLFLCPTSAGNSKKDRSYESIFQTEFLAVFERRAIPRRILQEPLYPQIIAFFKMSVLRDPFPHREKGKAATVCAKRTCWLVCLSSGKILLLFLLTFNILLHRFFVYSTRAFYHKFLWKAAQVFDIKNKSAPN